MHASCDELTVYMVTETATIMDLGHYHMVTGIAPMNLRHGAYIGLGGTGSSSIASGITW